MLLATSSGAPMAVDCAWWPPSATAQPTSPRPPGSCWPRWSAHPGSPWWELGGLDPTRVCQLLVRLVEHQLDEGLGRFAAELHATTGGNPFLVGEQWRSSIEQGRLLRTGGVWTATAERAVGPSPVPVRRLIGDRVAALGPAATTLLRVAAAAGLSFDADVVAGAAGLEVPEGLAVLTPPWMPAWWWTCGRDGSASVTTWWPRRSTTALLRNAAGHPPGPGPDLGGAPTRRADHLADDQIAHHHLCAVPLVPAHVAVDWARRAAVGRCDPPSGGAAMTDAADILREALTVAGPGLDRADVLTDLSQVLSRSGDLVASLAAADEAGGIARAADDAGLLLVGAALATRELVLAQRRKGAPLRPPRRRPPRRRRRRPSPPARRPVLVDDLRRS